METFTLNLTRLELTHLRDLFNIKLPTEMHTTVSQALAATEQRDIVETTSWAKIVAACRQAKLPLDHQAPDFIVAAVGSPTMNVFQLSSDPVSDSEHQEFNPDGDASMAFPQDNK